MKKYLLIAAVMLPMTSQAICFGTFKEEGYGVSEILAAADADKEADEKCGSSTYDWKSRKSEFVYDDLSTEAEILIRAKATYQCCTQW